MLEAAGVPVVCGLPLPGLTPGSCGLSHEVSHPLAHHICGWAVGGDPRCCRTEGRLEAREEQPGCSLKLFPRLRATASKGTAYSPLVHAAAGERAPDGGRRWWQRVVGSGRRGSLLAGEHRRDWDWLSLGPRRGGVLLWAEMASSRARKISLPCLVSNSKLPSPETQRRPASKEKVTWKVEKACYWGPAAPIPSFQSQTRHLQLPSGWGGACSLLPKLLPLQVFSYKPLSFFLLPSIHQRMKIGTEFILHRLRYSPPRSSFSFLPSPTSTSMCPSPSFSSSPWAGLIFWPVFISSFLPPPFSLPLSAPQLLSP